MSSQLESALVIALQDTIPWGSSIDGTFSPINPNVAIDVKSYSARDRVLAYRDLLVSAAVIQASIQVTDVYSYPTIKPNLEGSIGETFTFDVTASGSVNSRVRHVTNTSIPYDAARYADADLYGRDALVYEVLARACQTAFVNSPVPRVDPTGAVIADVSAWSLAEGASSLADVNAALPLNTSLFKAPDTYLAGRDNVIAAYAARLVQVLKNPFQSALRILVQTTVGGIVEREPEVYALISDDGTNRIFAAEPTTTACNRIVYNIGNKTLQWFRENANEIHVPQIYALVIPGIDVGQQLQTVPSIPTDTDAQFWRSKAKLIRPTGAYREDLAKISRTDSASTIGGFAQICGVSLTTPGLVNFSFGALGTGNLCFNVLVKPNPNVEIAGQSNSAGITGTAGGVDFPIGVASGSIGTNTYLVENGYGIVYNSVTYLPGSTFTGVAGVTTYTQVATGSTVRLYSVSYPIALPPGTWSLTVQYADLTGSSTGFNIAARYTPNSADTIVIGSDTVPLVPAPAGALATSPASLFEVADTRPGVLTIRWTFGAGQLHIRKLTLTSTATSDTYSLTATYQGVSSSASFTGKAFQPEIIRFPGTAASNTSANLTLTSNTGMVLPLQVLQVDVQTFGTNAANPLSSAFQNWRQECTDRAERSIQQQFYSVLSAYVNAGSSVPTFSDSGSNWSKAATEGWMGFLESTNPRLRQQSSVGAVFPGRQYKATASATYNGTSYTSGQTFYGVAGISTFTGSLDQVGALVKSSPGHVGYPCLVPHGIYVDNSGTRGVKARHDTPDSVPRFVTCQPWMVEYGFYVCQQEFWMPDTI